MVAACELTLLNVATWGESGGRSRGEGSMLGHSLPVVEIVGYENPSRLS